MFIATRPYPWAKSLQFDSLQPTSYCRLLGFPVVSIPTKKLSILFNESLLENLRLT